MQIIINTEELSENVYTNEDEFLKDFAEWKSIFPDFVARQFNLAVKSKSPTHMLTVLTMGGDRIKLNSHSKLVRTLILYLAKEFENEVENSSDKRLPVNLALNVLNKFPLQLLKLETSEDAGIINYGNTLKSVDIKRCFISEEYAKGVDTLGETDYVACNVLQGSIDFLYLPKDSGSNLIAGQSYYSTKLIVKEVKYI